MNKPITAMPRRLKKTDHMFFSDAELHICFTSAIGATALSRGTGNSPIKEYYLYHHNQFG